MKRILSLIAFVFYGTVAFAQQAGEAGDVVVSLDAVVRWNPTIGSQSATATLSCYALQATQGSAACSVTSTRGASPLPYQGNVATPRLPTRFVPGVIYTVILSVDNIITNYPMSPYPGATQVLFRGYAPAGYTIDINRTGASELNVALNSTTRYASQSVTMCLRPVSNGISLPAGMATSLSVDRVLWQLSLGNIASGDSAGLISFNALASSTTLAGMFTRANLFTDASSSDVVVTGDAGNVNIVRQIIAPQVCVDISGTFDYGAITLKCYHRSQRSSTADGSGYFTFTGEPFAWYTISPQGSDAAGVIITNDVRDLASATTTGQTVVRTLTTKVTRTGSAPDFTWTAEDWHTGATALVKSVRARSGNTETITSKDNNDVVAITKTRTYATMQMGEEIISETIGTLDPVTTYYDFYSDDSLKQTLYYGRLKSSYTSAGSWQIFEYDEDGQVQVSHSPYGNSDIGLPSGFPNHTGVKAFTTYSSDPFGRKTRIATSEIKVNGTTVSNTTSDYSYETPFSAFASSHPYLRILSTAMKSYTANTPSFLTSTTKFFAEDVGIPSNTSTTPLPLATDDYLRRQLHATIGTDGVVHAYVYQRGTGSGQYFVASGNCGLDDGPASRMAIITGPSANPGGGATLYSSYGGYPVEPLYLIDGKSTLELAYRDDYANVVRTESHVWSAGTWNLIKWVDFTYNLSGQLTSQTTSSGAVCTANYSGERKTDETDESGVTTNYTYDATGRAITTTKSSGTTTTLTYSAASQVLTEMISATPAGLGETIYASHTYDDAGRIRTDLPVGMAAITHSYNVAARSHTVLYPDGGTRTEYALADGKTDHVDGSAVVAEYYTYTIETDGRQTTQVNSGSVSSPRTRKVTADWLGRGTHSERPGFSISAQGVSSEDNTFEAGTGRLIKSTRTGYAPIRYSYDALGRVNRAGLDIGDNGLISASADRITERDGYFEKIGTDWWLRHETKTYPQLNDGTTVVTTAITRRRLSGHPAGRLDESQETDADGNVATRTVDVNRATATTIVTTNGPGVSASETETSVNGLVTSVTSHDGLTSSVEYDALNRAWRSTDSRGNKVTTTFKYGTTMPETVIDGAANTVITVSYDNMARRQWTKDANNQYTRFAYNQRGQLTHQWGGGTYPVSYGYDATTGERTSLNTYRNDLTDNATSNSSTTWPAATVGVADTTNWTYDGATGLLWKKTDAATQVTEFDYNSRGQTSTRKWARRLPSNASIPVTTTYGYDGNTGELLTQTYNDQSETIITPNVTYTYTRLGQVATVSDGTGSRTFGYNASSPWQQDTESLDGSFYASRVLTRIYDGASGIGGVYGPYTPGFVKGRYTGYDLGVVGSTARDQHVYYTTSNLARFVGVNTRITTGSARDYVYSYQANSRLLAGYVMGSLAVSRGYESQRDLLTSIQASWNGTNTTRFDYNYNPKGQRYTAKQGGSAFADYATTGTGAYSNTFQTYTYNARGELETSAQYRGDTPPAVGSAPSAGDELPGRRYEFRYDSLGNRKTAGSTDSAATGANEYSTNALNQYTGRENNTVRVNGTAAANAVVNVGGAPTTAKKDRAWGTEIVPANSAGPAQGTASVYAAINNGGTGAADQIKIDGKTYTVPKAWQVFTYDADGNMTGDGIWLYTYDAENRLVRMQVDSVAVAAGLPNRTLYFSYDYQGRRVEKRSVNVTATTDVTNRYLYDGYNLIAETNTSGALQRLFTWGLDISGELSTDSRGGALLQIDDLVVGKTLAATYDGNGNIAALVNVGSGVTEAAYEYNSFGELLRADGAYAKFNPFRFSTKWQDDESSLINYGFRYYSPTLGRFINRDPIAEKGGLNLYGFCGNDGVNGSDYLGLEPVTVLSTFVVPGAKGGSTFGPVGTVVGAAIGAIVGVLGKLFGFWGSGGGAAVKPKRVEPAKNTKDKPFEQRHVKSWVDPDPAHPGHYTCVAPETWVENGWTIPDGPGTGGWVSPEKIEPIGSVAQAAEEVVQLPKMVIYGSRGPSFGSSLLKFGVGLMKGAAIGLAAGVAIGALVTVAPAALPFVIAAGGIALIHSTYQWAKAGYNVTAEGAGEFIGGFATGGLGARLGGAFARLGRATLQDLLGGILAKSGAIPKTGVAFYDDLAVNSQHFDRFISSIKARGFSVRASELIPANNPAFIRPGNQTFYYNPKYFTKLDMLHEIQHFQQLRAAGNLKTGGGLLQTYEFQAYQFEFNLGLQNGFSGEYMQYLQQQMRFYGL